MRERDENLERWEVRRNPVLLQTKCGGGSGPGRGQTLLLVRAAHGAACVDEAHHHHRYSQIDGRSEDESAPSAISGVDVLRRR